VTIKVDKRSQWHDPGFEPSEGPSRDFDQFAPVDSRGFPLRGWIERELQTRSASSGTNTTLVPGKLYLRQQPCGLWELIHNRGRGTFDCYVGETREEMLQLAEELQNQKVG
jgi:hypothetical protein